MANRAIGAVISGFLAPTQPDNQACFQHVKVICTSHKALQSSDENCPMNFTE